MRYGQKNLLIGAFYCEGRFLPDGVHAAVEGDECVGAPRVDTERIGDHAENVADAARQRKEEGVSISKEAQKELGDMLEMVNKIIRYAVEMFAKSDESHMQEIVTLEDQVDEKERELQKKHVERLTKGECSPEAGMIFSDIVSGLERVADHATNIAFAITTEEDAEDGDIKR